MKKRKVLAVLLCAAMTAALAVGCGGAKDLTAATRAVIHQAHPMM